MIGKKGNVLGAVLMVIMAMIALTVGNIIVAEMNSNIDITGYDTDTQEAINATRDNTNTAFKLMPVSILILGAITVISAVALLGGRA